MLLRLRAEGKRRRTRGLHAGEATGGTSLCLCLFLPRSAVALWWRLPGRARFRASSRVAEVRRALVHHRRLAAGDDLLRALLAHDRRRRARVPGQHVRAALHLRRVYEVLA